MSSRWRSQSAIATAGHAGCFAFAERNRPVRGVVAILVLAALAWAVSAHAANSQIDRGRALFNQVCAPCHGRDMVTDGVRAFDLRKFPKDASGRFRDAVRNGRGNVMPAWGGALSEDDITVLWDYVRSGG